MKRKAETIGTLEILESYLSEKQANGITGKTLKDYEKELTGFLSLSNSIQYFSKKFIIDYTKKLLERMKPVSVNHYLRTIRAFLYWCMDNGYLEPYKINLVKEQEAPIKIYSEEDILKLLAIPSKKDSFTTWRSWAMCCFVLGTGARAGTIANIKLEDVNLQTQEVVYRHTKNKKSAIVPMCDVLIKSLRLYIKEFELTEYLFPTVDNKQINNEVINKSFKKFCESREVPFNTFHALRHTFSKQFILNGGNPFQLQKMLDHQTLTMSQHYTHLFGSDLHGVVNDFSPLSKLSENQNKVKRKDPT